MSYINSRYMGLDTHAACVQLYMTYIYICSLVHSYNFTSSSYYIHPLYTSVYYISNIDQWPRGEQRYSTFELGTTTHSKRRTQLVYNNTLCTPCVLHCTWIIILFVVEIYCTTTTTAGVTEGIQYTMRAQTTYYYYINILYIYFMHRHNVRKIVLILIPRHYVESLSS